MGVFMAFNSDFYDVEWY